MMEIGSIGAFTAFAAGVISFLSPCVLPLVPGYLSYVSGQSLDQMRGQGLSSRQTWAVTGLGLLFVLGFSTVFIAFGASATAIGRWLASYRQELNLVGGAIVVLFGLLMTGLIKIQWLQREFRFHGDLKGGRKGAAYLLGVAFAFGWTPCIGPVLGAILTISATSGQEGTGTTLLAIYSLGLGLPFLLSALFTDRFLRHASRMRRHGRLLHAIAGGLLILMGIAMMTGYLTDFSIWLLKVFPWLGEIG